MPILVYKMNNLLKEQFTQIISLANSLTHTHTQGRTGRVSQCPECWIFREH